MRWLCYKYEGIFVMIVFNWIGWLILGGREGGRVVDVFVSGCFGSVGVGILSFKMVD